ncbi:MAG TPA: PilZ domain-containing protein [Gemmataceae bacterium]|nr:PilZ domain-containing protein [Gemmataceae bacterium]
MATERPITRQRRLDPRRQPKGSVRIACRKGDLDLGPNLSVGSVDLSETGVRLQLTTHLTPRQEVTLTLDGPNHRRPIKRHARVIWCVPAHEGGFYVGLQFEKRLGYADLIKFV